MSEPSLAQAQAEGWEIARENCLVYFGREPTEEEIQEEYEALCERHR